MVAAAKELGIALVAYSPLGRGILSGAIRSTDDVNKPGDMRGSFDLPFFSSKGGNLEKNISLVEQTAPNFPMTA